MKAAHGKQHSERRPVNEVDVNHSGLMNFDDIADYISKAEGKRISRQAIAAQHQKALQKLRIAIAEDPRLQLEFLEAL